MSGSSALMERLSPAEGEAIAARAVAAARFDGFVEEAVARLGADPRVVGLLRHGSSASGEADEYSDLDLTLVLAPEYRDQVDRLESEIAGAIGALAVCRPVPVPREGRVLFCLYAPDMLRVEIGFKPLGNLGGYAEPPRIELDKTGGALERELAGLDYRWIGLDPEEIEARFWLCVELGIRRLGRREIFEALDTLAILRKAFLGPMLSRREGLPPRGLRQIERVSPAAAERLVGTMGGLDFESCRLAFLVSVDLFCELQGDDPPPRPLDEVARAMRSRLERMG